MQFILKGLKDSQRLYLIYLQSLPFECTENPIQTMKPILLRMIVLIAFVLFLNKGIDYGYGHYKFWCSSLGFIGFLGLAVWDFNLKNKKS
jgi:hypothetical protein